MKLYQKIMLVTFSGIVLGACSGNKGKQSADSSKMATDTTNAATSVKPADSTHSFRNDRGTDSVSAGKSVPAKP